MLKLNTTDNINFFIPKSKKFIPMCIQETYIKETFQFAYDMTFGEIGEHRNHRSGGSHYRKKGEIFCDTFQGKLAEFYFYQCLTINNIKLNKPNTEKWELGRWDNSDFVVNKKKINIKSMAFFSNLFLLETKDWDLNGKYIPNNEVYDFFVIIRIKPDIKSLFKQNRMLYANTLKFNEIEEVIFKNIFEADIRVYLENTDLIDVIRSKQILPKASILNGKIRMDAENFYVISEDFKNINQLYQLMLTINTN